jgi:hypothetical protein
MHSAVLGRRLPGILECGLWDELARRPAVPTRALVTDVGNDILYGADAQTILGWIEAGVVRLEQASAEIVMTGLPLHAVRRLTRARYLFFRSVLVPRCRLSLARVQDVAERVAEGLRALAERHALRFQSLRAEWYGFDPVHFRPGRWGAAWREILGGGELVSVARPSVHDAMALYLARPARQWRFGLEQVRAQPVREGVWLY